jgi:hypothetical protein
MQYFLLADLKFIQFMQKKVISKIPRVVFKYSAFLALNVYLLNQAQTILHFFSYILATSKSHFHFCVYQKWIIIDTLNSFFCHKSFIKFKRFQFCNHRRTGKLNECRLVNILAITEIQSSK